MHPGSRRWIVFESSPALYVQGISWLVGFIREGRSSDFTRYIHQERLTKPSFDDTWTRRTKRGLIARPDFDSIYPSLQATSRHSGGTSALGQIQDNGGAFVAYAFVGESSDKQRHPAARSV